MKKVLVTGGRHYGINPDEMNFVFNRLYLLLGKIGAFIIIEGGATGADECARLWAKKNEMPCITHPAKWKKEKRKAGPIRNQAMIDLWNPDLVLAFPGNAGTADMTRRAEKAEIKVYRI